MEEIARRRLLKYLAAIGGGGTTAAMAQFAPSPSRLCADGQKEKLEIWNEPVTYSASLASKLGGPAGSIPVMMMRYRLTCEDLPRPPPPPPKPAPRSTWWDPFESGVVAYPSDLIPVYSAAQFYVGLSLPPFMSFASLTAQVAVQAIMPNGVVANATFGLIKDGLGFRFASPNAVDYWSATAGAQGVAGSIQVRDIAVIANSGGYGRYGIALFVSNIPICARAADISAIQSNPNQENSL